MTQAIKGPSPRGRSPSSSVIRQRTIALATNLQLAPTRSNPQQHAMDPAVLKAKVFSAGEGRMVPLASADWAGFEERVKKVFGIAGALRATYVDADGDRVTVSTTDELRELLAAGVPRLDVAPAQTGEVTAAAALAPVKPVYLFKANRPMLRSLKPADMTDEQKAKIAELRDRIAKLREERRASLAASDPAGEPRRAELRALWAAVRAIAEERRVEKLAGVPADPKAELERQARLDALRADIFRLQTEAREAWLAANKGKPAAAAPPIADERKAELYRLWQELSAIRKEKLAEKAAGTTVDPAINEAREARAKELRTKVFAVQQEIRAARLAEQPAGAADERKAKIAELREKLIRLREEHRAKKAAEADVPASEVQPTPVEDLEAKRAQLKSAFAELVVIAKDKAAEKAAGTIVDPAVSEAREAKAAELRAQVKELSLVVRPAGGAGICMFNRMCARKVAAKPATEQPADDTALEDKPFDEAEARQQLKPLWQELVEIAKATAAEKAAGTPVDPAIAEAREARAAELRTEFNAITAAIRASKPPTVCRWRKAAKLADAPAPAESESAKPADTAKQAQLDRLKEQLRTLLAEKRADAPPAEASVAAARDAAIKELTRAAFALGREIRMAACTDEQRARFAEMRARCARVRYEQMGKRAAAIAAESGAAAEKLVADAAGKTAKPEPAKHADPERQAKLARIREIAGESAKIHREIGDAQAKLDALADERRTIAGSLDGWQRIACGPGNVPVHGPGMCPPGRGGWHRPGMCPPHHGGWHRPGMCPPAHGGHGGWHRPGMCPPPHHGHGGWHRPGMCPPHHCGGRGHWGPRC